MSFRIHGNGASQSENEPAADRPVSRFAPCERIFTVPYFSTACLARFDVTCDGSIEQIVYLQALIEDDA